MSSVSDAVHERQNALVALDASRRSITWRSVALGSAAVAVVCALAPYNDYVVANTWLVGSYLPPILILFFFVLIVLVNGPLHRWAPGQALSHGELAVVMTMTLMGCSIPGQGLMRQFLPTLVAPFYLGGQDAAFWK